LTPALETKIAFDGDQVVVVRRELVHVRQRTRWIKTRSSVAAHGSKCAALDVTKRETAGETIDDLAKSHLALTENRRVNIGLVHRFDWKKRRMPATPDHR